MAFFGKKGKKVKHDWEYIPYFQLTPEGKVVIVQKCLLTGSCRYLIVPSAKRLDSFENPAPPSAEEDVENGE